LDDPTTRALSLFFEPPTAAELRQEQMLTERKARDERPSRRFGGPTD